MIHLVAIQTSPGVWTITTSDMVEKYEIPSISVIGVLKKNGIVIWDEDVKKEGDESKISMP